MGIHLTSVKHSRKLTLASLPHFLLRGVLVFALLIIILTNTSQAQAAAAESDSNTVNVIAEQPVNLIDYVKEKIADNSTAEPIRPTRNLQANTEITGEFHEAYYNLDILPPPNPAVMVGESLFL